MSISNKPAGTREKAADRRAKALQLRLAGAPYRSIADALGVSKRTAYMDVQRSLQTLARQELSSAEQLRAMELARLDMLLMALNPGIKMGKVDAINAARQISESRRKLLGLDAPDQHLIAQFAYEVNIGEAEDAYAQPYIGDDAATPLLGE